MIGLKVMIGAIAIVAICNGKRFRLLKVHISIEIKFVFVSNELFSCLTIFLRVQ